MNDVVIDLNSELDQLGEDFDYRGKLRDETWVKDLAHRIVAEHKKLVSRSRIDSLSVAYRKATAPAKKAAKKVIRVRNRG